MSEKEMSYDLIERMLKEFVIILDGKIVHPDICDKGAAAIEELLAANKRMNTLLTGFCAACQHKGTHEIGSPCDSCYWNSRITGNQI